MQSSEPVDVETTKPPGPKIRRRIRLAVGLIVLAVIGIGAYEVIEVIRGPAVYPGAPPPAAAALTPDEKPYYDYVAPKLHDLIAELRLLAQLGGQKSRNIIVLQRHYTRASNLIDEIQTYQAGHPLPARFAPAATPLAVGVAQVQTAMSGAESAFFKFQFAKLGGLLAQFDKGADTVNQAVTLLDQLGGGTPVAKFATP
jgi:hypothetical protein